MKLSSKLLLIILAVFFSCSDKAETTGMQPNATDSTIQAGKKHISRIGVSLEPYTKKEIANWEEYQLVDAILINFYAISNAEAMSNAQELTELVTHLKDSIRDKNLMTPPVKARINILHNECLRLNDMTNIPAITPEEVTASVKKILASFSGLNAKLNSHYAITDLESELKLDPDFLEILKDSAKTEELDFSLSKPQEKTIPNKTNKTTKPVLKKRQLQKIDQPAMQPK